MFVDGDPKDPTETEDIDTTEEQEEFEEPTGDEDPADGEGDEEPEAGDEDDQGEEQEQSEEDDDLPTDPKALRHIVREQQKMLERSNREPAARTSNATDEEPDPLMQSIAAVIKDKSLPIDLRRALYGLTQKLAQTEQEASLARRDASKVTEDSVVRSIPKSRREGVLAISKKFGVPVPVAHELYKGQLYDQAVARSRAKRSGSPPPDASTPTRKAGSAQHTFTRPVRGGSVGSSGATAVDIAGVKVPLKFKSSSEYATFMDGLPSDKHRAIVLKARRNGTAAQIAG